MFRSESLPRRQILLLLTLQRRSNVLGFVVISEKLAISASYFRRFRSIILFRLLVMAILHTLDTERGLFAFNRVWVRSRNTLQGAFLAGFNPICTPLGAPCLTDNWILNGTAVEEASPPFHGLLSVGWSSFKHCWVEYLQTRLSGPFAASAGSPWLYWSNWEYVSPNLHSTTGVLSLLQCYPILWKEAYQNPSLSLSSRPHNSRKDDNQLDYGPMRPSLCMSNLTWQWCSNHPICSYGGGLGPPRLHLLTSASLSWSWRLSPPTLPFAFPASFMSQVKAVLWSISPAWQIPLHSLYVQSHWAFCPFIYIPVVLFLLWSFTPVSLAGRIQVWWYPRTQLYP